MDKNKVWAQLVSTTEIYSDPIHVTNDKFTFGRAQGNDLVFADNAYVSGSHCYIEKDRTNGTVVLHDTSTNGTLLNLATKLHREKHELKHGDEIFIVHRKDHVKCNVSYLYQDIEELCREREKLSDSNTSNEADRTQPYETILEDCSVDNGQTLEYVDDSKLPPSKKPRLAGDGSQSSGSSRFSSTYQPPVAVSRASSNDTIDGSQSWKENIPDPVQRRVVPSNVGISEASTSGSKQPAGGCCTQSDPTTPAGGGNISPTSSTVVPAADSNLMALVGDPVQPEPSGSKPSDTTTTSTDGIEESLICIICQEILYNCVSLQPCMHSFCAACYSEWMQRSNECPSCRMKVERINKNHLVNNLVEAFLKSNPSKKRPDDELKEHNAKNKITNDMLYPRNKHRDDSFEYDTDYGGDDDNGTDNSEYDDAASSCQPQFQQNFGIIGYPVPVNLATVRPVKTICRQCPESQSQAANSAAAVSAADAVPGPSNADAASAQLHPAAFVAAAAAPAPAPPAYTCSPAQVHILCLCCAQPMPDRRKDHVFGVVIPPQSCVVCQHVYCHMYWGCRRAGCHGCLGKFKDFPVDQDAMKRIVLDNEFESEILQKYLDGQKWTAKDLLTECCRRLLDGSYTCTDQHFLASGEAVVCVACFRRNFSELVYQYRQDIPNDELPAGTLANRPNCYWGRSCRTQKNKLAHAQKFNHFCEQSRAT